MTGPTPEQLIAGLDTRASGAVAALDDAVDRSPIADFSPPAHERRRRWIPPIAIAAGLLVLALVAAALLFTGGDENSAIAGEGDPTHLVLPDPAAFGYRIVAAVDGSEPAQADGLAKSPVSILGPAGADDPWAEAVVSYALPTDASTLGGDPVDIGGPEAAFESSSIGNTVGWVDGAETHYVVSTRVGRTALVDLASGLVAAEDVPPGYQTLFRGLLSDVFSMAMTSVGRGGLPAAGRPTAAIFYASASEDAEAGLGVMTTRGSNDLRRASLVLATDTRDATVRGHEALIASVLGAEGFLTASWLEDDGTLVRVDAFGIDEAELVAQLDQLESIGTDAFHALAREHPFDSARPGGVTEETFEETGQPIDTTDVLGEVLLSEGDVTYAAAVRRADDGSLTLEVREDGPNSGSSSGTSIESLDVPTALRHEAADGGLVIAGAIGPDITKVDVAPDDGLTKVLISGPSTASISNSSTVVFMAVLSMDASSTYTIVGTRTDGTEIRLEV